MPPVRTMPSRKPTLRRRLIRASITGILLVNYTVSPAAGALAVSEQPVIIGPAAYTQSGTLFLGIDPNTTITPPDTKLDLAGVRPTLLEASSLTPLVGSLIVGLALEPTPNSAALALTGTAPIQALAERPTGVSLALTGLQGTAISGLVTLVAPTTGSLATVGLASATRGDNTIPTSPGTLAFPEVLAAPVNGTLLTPAVGSLVITGNAVNATGGTQPGTGSLSLTGAAPVIGGFNSLRFPTAGSLVFGLDSVVASNADRQPTTGSLLLGEPRDPITGTLALTGYAPNLGAVNAPLTGSLFFGLSPSVSCQPTTGALTLVGLQARPNPPDDTALRPDSGTLRLFRVPEPVAGSLGLTSAAPLMRLGMTPDLGALAMSGQSALVFQTIAIRPNAAGLTLTGTNGTLTNRGVITGAGTFATAGYQPTLQEFGGAPPSTTNVRPATAALGLVGLDSIVDIGVQAMTGTLILAGNAATLAVFLAPSTGTIAMTGTVPSLSIGAIVVPTGSLTLIGSAPEFPGRLAPATGALTLSGGRPSMGTSPIIATSILQEGCAGTTGLAQEGCTSTTAVSVEGEISTTTTVCDYV